MLYRLCKLDIPRIFINSQSRKALVIQQQFTFWFELKHTLVKNHYGIDC